MLNLLNKFRLPLTILFLYVLLEVVILKQGLNLLEAFPARLAAFTAFAIACIATSNPKKQAMSTIVMPLVPLLALAVVTIVTIDPLIADNLALEDGFVEWLSAIFLFIGSAFMLFFTGVLIFKKQSPLTICAAFLLAFVFFIIGMEEVSWMQRIFDIKTPEYLQEVNRQKEFNFHNIVTMQMELAYYSGGFLLLVLLPYARDSLQSFLNKIKPTRSLHLLLPASWLLVPFSVISFFVIPYVDTGEPSLLNPLYMAIYVFTLFILFAATQRKDISVYPAATVSIALALIAAVAAVLIFAFTNYSSVQRYWLAFEYRECFIALGIVVYAMERVSSFFAENKKQNQIHKTRKQRAIR